LVFFVVFLIALFLIVAGVQFVGVRKKESSRNAARATQEQPGRTT
jgi:hypothetical protein